MARGCKWVYVLASNSVPLCSSYWKQYIIKAMKSWENNGAPNLKVYRILRSSYKQPIVWDLNTARASGILEEVC